MTNVKFDDAIEETDYGLIICGVTGKLKGIWIPEGKDEVPVPDTVANLCIEYFGVDPNTEEEVIIH